MTTEAMTRAEALTELAAIRRAKPLYRQPKAAAKAEAAEAAKEAAAKAAAAARAALPKVAEADTTANAPKLAWHIINGREYARAEAAQFWAEQRAMDRAARQAAKAEARRAELSIYSAGLVLDSMAAAELKEAAAKAAAKAAKAGTKTEAAALRLAPKAARAKLALEAAAAELGVSPEELTEAADIERAMLAEARNETFGAAPEAGAYSMMAPKAYAEFRDYTRNMLASPAAAKGRAALDAMGATAQAMVSVTWGSQELIVSELAAVPSLPIAKARHEKCRAIAYGAKAKAETAAAKAEAKTYVRETIAKAEAEAGKLAKLTATAEARLARAEAIEAAAEAAEAIPGSATGYVAIPVAKLPLEAAAEAAKLPVRHAVGRMPATYAHKGPSAKAAPKLVDNTATIAIANVMGQTAEAEAEAAEALRLSIAAKVAELTAKATEARQRQAEATRAGHKARAALALRIKRRAAKNK